VILLDTHVLVWAVGDTERLSRAAASEIKRARQGGGLAVSAITPWELGLLVNRGRIQTYGTVESSIRQLLEDVTIRPVTYEIPPWPCNSPMIILATPPIASSAQPPAPKA
jgi:PIN domain nuclease of toxin-antitoxin system